MDYAEATRYLISLGNEVRASASDSVHAFKLGLENITELLKDLGNPQDSYPSVLIAGTNGKGSVAAMLERVLRVAGERLDADAAASQSPQTGSSATPAPFRTGLYTSPHLVEINERIQVSGRKISPDEFGELFTFLHGRIEALLASGRLRFHPTYFECLTAMAMEYFRRQRCNIVVFEVGMGGRLDATNIATPRISVITEIDFDHERFLGRTIAAIAAEKAGIIKPGGVVVTSATHPEALRVIRDKARDVGARLLEAPEEYMVDDLASQDGRYSFTVHDHDGFRLAVRLKLRGRHQVGNALAAIAAARELAEMGFPLTGDDIERGLALAEWPGRLEVVRENPLIFLDGAHNPSGARALERFWQEEFPPPAPGTTPSRRIILVYGAMRDKAVPEIAEILFPRASVVILTRPDQGRSTSPETVRSLGEHLSPNIICVDDAGEALKRALSEASPGDAIFVTGSLYLVGDIKRRLAEAALRERGAPGFSGGSTGANLPAAARH
jgi:dihydrofolate synthase/folylpolyglutamate synthase